MAGLPAVTAVSCGLSTSVALCAPTSSSAAATTGTVWEWGGKCGHCPTSVPLPDGAAPALVAAGARHRACACLDGRLFIWGSGRAVQGLQTLPQCVDDVRVGIKPHALACTWRGTGFIAGDGRVNVLGPNDFLQHGTGAASASSRGIVTFADGDSCAKLLAGSEHFCAVLSKADGSARIVTWGWGEHGQLGNGAAADSPPCSVAYIPADENAHVATGAAFVVLCWQ